VRFSTLLAAALGATLLAATAHADEASESKARALFAEGNQAAQQGDHAGALALFQQAYALLPSEKILLNIGTMLRQLGRNVEAANAYEAYLRDPAAAPDKKAAVAALLPELDAQVGKLRVVIAGGAATVRIDGKLVDPALRQASPGSPASVVVTVRVEPGPHVVRVQREVGFPARVDAQAIAGRETLVSVDLPPAGVLPAPARVEPGSPPPSAAPEPSGVGSESPAPRNLRWTFGAVSLGVGAASLAAGAATAGAAALKRASTLKLCPQGPTLCPPSEQPDIDAYNRLGAASTATFIAGGALAATGVILMVTSPRGRPTAGAWVTPVVGPGVLGVRGKF
jgi:hypothetical protein